ncbi:MAG: class I SAM-dependent methyltransferase [Candidatus Aminicenantaceae bacterium]
MTEDRKCHNLEKLRSPERLALLEVERVVQLTLEGCVADSILDIGTGSGLFAEAFSQLGLEVAGIDEQEKMLTAARSFVPGGEFRIASAESLPFSDASFDLGFLGHVLHESEIPLLVLQEARRVCRRRVAVLEWPFQEEAEGPPRSHRLKSDEVLNYASEAGFKHSQEIRLKHMVLFLLDQ